MSENASVQQGARAAKVRCGVCPHACLIAEGRRGMCRARGTVNGENVSLNYGILSSLALDPIEKKPLYRFYPGSSILSAGSFGCDLSCPFCQNHEISMSDGREFDLPDRHISPEELADIAYSLKSRGNIGVAFTYNEPLIGWEYVADTAKLLREMDLRTVLVTNGCVTDKVADEVLPLTDALNIDLKCFSAETYSGVLGGDLEAVKRFIKRAAETCHVELTTLIVPGMNDSEEEMRELSGWVASLPGGRDIPLHVTRFFPRYKMADKKPTGKATVLRLADVAAERLNYVYPGNI